MRVSEIQKGMKISEADRVIKEDISNLPPIQQRNQYALLSYYKRFEKYDEEYEKIIKKLVYTYGTQVAQVLQDINVFASAEKQPTPQQLKDIGHFFTATERATLLKTPSEPLSNYWPKIMRTHFKNRRFKSSGYKMITKKDFEVLQYLRKLEYKVLPPHGNIQFNFYFAPNPFFGNTILNTLLIYPSSRIYKEQALIKVEASAILWRKGINLHESAVTEEVMDPVTKEKQVVTRVKRQNTFFHFFTEMDFSQDDEDEDPFVNMLLRHYMELSDELEFAVLPYQLRLYLVGQIEDYELPSPPSSYHSSDDEQIFEVEDEEWEYKNKLKQVMIVDDDEPDFD